MIRFLTCGPLVVAGLMAAALARPAPAQAPAAFDANEFAARSIARLALLDLRSTTLPTDADYRIAESLLSIAHDIVPNDTEVLRRLIEAAFAVGDGETVLSMTRALLDLDGADTVAQLRLITASIAQNNQNADDRIRVYEQFLDPKGKGRLLDPAILSRLALDEALLLRERGDSAGFIAKLTQAVQLDATHKEAIQLATATYVERFPDDRIGHLHWLEMLLMADPVDPNIHLAIAHELVAGGAHKAAQRFGDNALAIMSAAGGNLDVVALEAQVHRWYSQGPAKVAERLNRDLAAAKDEAEREIRRLKEKGIPIAKARKPEDVELTPTMQLLYLLALDAQGDTAAIKSTIQRYADTAARAVTQLQEAVQRGEIKQEQATRVAAESAASLDLLRLWTNVGVEEARADLGTNQAIALQSPALKTMLDGWLAVRSNDPRAGRAILEPLMDSDQHAAIGVAQALELEGDKNGAIAIYQRLAREQVLDPIGAWCHTRLARLGAKDDEKAAEQLERAVKDIPAWIDDMSRQPHQYVELSVRLTDLSPSAIDRATARVSLQNLSRIPLALGTDRPLSSRLLVAPRLEAMGTSEVSVVRPEVVDIDRRLRLMPNERLEADIWPDAGQSGWLMECTGNRNTRVRYRVIQGFQVDPRGGFRPAVLGLVTETDSAVRRPIPECSASPEDMVAGIAGEPAATIPRIAAAIRALVLQPVIAPALNAMEQPAVRGAPNPARGDPVPAPVAEAFAARYPKLTPVDRAMLAAVLPHAGIAPAFAAVDQAMRAETDPVPLCVILTSRITDPKDELLAKAAQSEDARVRAMAADVARRLEGDAKIYARFKATGLAPAAPGGPGAEK